LISVSFSNPDLFVLNFFLIVPSAGWRRSRRLAGRLIEVFPYRPSHRLGPSIRVAVPAWRHPLSVVPADQDIVNLDLSASRRLRNATSDGHISLLHFVTSSPRQFLTAFTVAAPNEDLFLVNFSVSRPFAWSNRRIIVLLANDKLVPSRAFSATSS